MARDGLTRCAALLESGAEIVFKPFIEGLSTTNIVNRIKSTL